MHHYLSDGIDFSSVSRVLVIKLQHLGDVLLTTPVFSIIKEKYPDIEIDALIYAETKAVLTNNPAINNIYLIDRKWKKQGKRQLVQQEIKLYNKLKQRKYDLIINFTDRLRGAWLTRLLKPKFSVSQKYKHKRGAWWMNSFSHLYSAPATERHTVEVHLDALRRLGMVLLNTEKKLVFCPGDNDVANVKKLIEENLLESNGYILVHPTSRWMFKAWSQSGFAKLLDKLVQSGYRVVITSGPDTAEIEYADKIIQRLNADIINLCGQLTLKELAVLIENSSCFIGLDSVAMHMAAAMETPCVALFGPSNDHIWYPWNVKHIVVTEKYSCRPCNMDGCGSGKISECLHAISSDRVMAAVQEITNQ